MEKSVDDERSRTKKDTTLIAINVLSILLTAYLINVIPADRKSSGRKKLAKPKNEKRKLEKYAPNTPI